MKFMLEIVWIYSSLFTGEIEPKSEIQIQKLEN
jgi:hypothetical protein